MALVVGTVQRDTVILHSYIKCPVLGSRFYSSIDHDFILRSIF